MKAVRAVFAFSLVLGLATQTSASLSSRCYVRDGLIGMWDGEENAGGWRS